MNQGFLDLIFYWILPMSLSFGAFLIFKKLNKKLFERTDTDRVWVAVIKIGIGLGILAILYVSIINTTWFKNFMGYAQESVTSIGKTQAAQTVGGWIKQGIAFLMNWVPVYVRAFAMVWFVSIIVMVQSLIWRISFYRGLNIFVQTIVLYPLLLVKYLFGYQTPVFDHIYSMLYVAKLKENLNDSFFDALQGVDERGQKFENGVGGTVQTQKIKKAAIAIRRTKSIVRTAGGIRHAELVTKLSREEDSNKLIKQSLEGLGQRLSAPSIRFQDDPIDDSNTLKFDSDVKYSAGDALGRFRDIFVSPFSADQKIVNGGDGVPSAIVGIVKSFVSYFIHLTPAAILDQMRDRANLIYAMDTSVDSAKYKNQQNLDLSVVPEPMDPDGEIKENYVETQKLVAIKKAQERQEDVKMALNAVGLGGTFNKVVVGGATAIYYYTLPRSAKLPSDFDNIQKKLETILKVSETPVLTIAAGELSVSLNNGVNVPVDFRKMIEDRPMGMSNIMEGIAGVDALGKPIEFKLGEKVPHAMIIGKTGVGKTVTILNIVYSMMGAVDPSMLKIYFIDGKGNSFEFFRTDNSNSPDYHPNPFIYAQPADGSGDIRYARAAIKHLEGVVRKRIQMFKDAGVSKLSEWNRKFPDKKIYELLAVIDEISAITDKDKELSYPEQKVISTVDTIEYIAKMARSTGVRMMICNQTARKQKLEGKITANIPGRLSLGVSEPIESDIALPESGISLHLIDQPGEFYTTMNSIRNPEHGNTPYLPNDVLKALNDSLEKKFGHHDYEFTREEIMAEVYGEEGLDGETEELAEVEEYPSPNPEPTVDTQFQKLLDTIVLYPEWAVANKTKPFILQNKYAGMGTPKQVHENRGKVRKALEVANQKVDQKNLENSAMTRSEGKTGVANVTKGKAGTTL